MKSGAMLALAIAATAAAALAFNSTDDAAPKPTAEPANAAPYAPASPHAPDADPHAGVPGAPPLHGGDGVLPPGHPPIDGAAADPHAGMPPGHPPVDGTAGEGGPIAVQALPGGVTVAQIVRDAESLAGKRVKLAAKVVKSTPNVLGRTWLHVQDGTGEAARGDHDLVVTTQDAVQVGDVVVLEGMVVRDRDLGSGYRYEVLLEDATVRSPSN